MHYNKNKSGLTVLEALDNLTLMSEINAYIVQESFEEVLQNRERLKEAFKVIFSYLQKVVHKGSDALRDPAMQRGIHALMTFANEAAQKMDRSTEAVEGRIIESILQVKEYQDLHHFYMDKIVSRFPKVIESSGMWLEGESYAADEGVPDVRGSHLADLVDVRLDRAYELFLIRKDDGLPFFNQHLVEHLKLVADFIPLLKEIETSSPFPKIQLIRDKDVQGAARKILLSIQAYVDAYYQVAMPHKDKEFVGSINKALMALMLAANPRNLMHNTNGKSCLDYYRDFQYYLRKALSCKDYNAYLAASVTKSNDLVALLLKVVHSLSSAFFMRMANQEEIAVSIRGLIEKGGAKITTDTPTHSPASIWNTLLDDDAEIRAALKEHPNGPLMKAIGLFLSEHQLEGFDPIAQKNAPAQSYAFLNNELHVTCLHLPSPTRQEKIGQAEIIEEFYGFLRSLKGKQKHLLINLQNPTSWEGHSRTLALEELQNSSRFQDVCRVVTLPKDGDFYLQAGPYENLNNSLDFIRQFTSQLESGKECGYFLPLLPDGFIDHTMNLIHVSFFGGKGDLVHKNRLDFIEIFFLILTLKIIEIEQPDTISFTCKDGIDTGAIASGEFFGFMKMINGSMGYKKEEKNELLSILYGPALMLRDRAVDRSCLERMVSALSLLSGFDVKKLIKT